MIWLLRHARPLIDPGVCYGVLDMPADAADTQAAAQRLAQKLPNGLLMLVSPLKRCQQLAHDLSSLRPDLRSRTDERLREMNFGQWEGARWGSIEPDAYAAWTNDFWHHRFGGAESLAEVMARVAQAWDEVVAQGQDQIWVTHAGVIRAASLLAAGVRSISEASQWPVNAPDYGCWLSLGKTSPSAQEHGDVGQ